MQKAEVLVLGAGIVGVSTALELQRRGIGTILIDRQEPGLGASFGNSGVIQREAVLPYAMPRNIITLISTVLGRNTAARLHWPSIPAMLPFLTRYWWHSSKARHYALATPYATLIERCMVTYERAMEGTDAKELMSPDGIVDGYRSRRAFEAARREADIMAQRFNLPLTHLEGTEAIRQVLPHIAPEFCAVTQYYQSVIVSDPHALLLKLFKKFKKLGGQFATADAMDLTKTQTGYSVPGKDRPLEGKHVVNALGAHAALLSAKFGLKPPIGLKRGYHIHFEPDPDAPLTATLADQAYGYVLTPKAAGIRLTTGAEFASLATPPSPVQVEQTEPIARKLHPLGRRLETTPWMGIRPCMPDMMPVIGEMPDQKNHWCAFGHGHQGLTLGPVTADIIADAIEGKSSKLNLEPFSPSRF